MKSYQNILVALELNDNADKTLLQKAQTIQAQFGGKLTLVHAVEHVGNYGAAYGASVGFDIEEELRKEAESIMTKTAASLNLEKDQQVIRSGSAKQVILEEAEQLKTDLILIGSHGKHGVQLLLGSTANAVLHHAKCDVLAVRLDQGD